MAREGPHRPLEVERHPDGPTGGHNAAVSWDDVAQGCPKGAGGFRRYHRLGVLEADAEEEAAGVAAAAPAPGAACGEGMHLELKDAGWFHLQGEGRERRKSNPLCAALTPHQVAAGGAGSLTPSGAAPKTLSSRPGPSVNIGFLSCAETSVSFSKFLGLLPAAGSPNAGPAPAVTCRGGKDANCTHLQRWAWKGGGAANIPAKLWRLVSKN